MIFERAFSVKRVVATMGPMRQRILQRLEQELKPARLEIVDDSQSHAEHEAMRRLQGHTETHLQIYVVSDAFRGLTPVARHRRVYALIQDELAHGGLHAVNIVTRTPDESP
jgi:stress-induced morphogen